MITALQNLGDGNPFKFSRARVVWIVEDPSRSMSSAWRSARNPPPQPAKRHVLQNSRTAPSRDAPGLPAAAAQQRQQSRPPQLSSREHIVADRDLAIAQQLAHALVDALISSADQHDALDPANSCASA